MTPKDAADELTPIDNLYDENQRLTREVNIRDIRMRQAEARQEAAESELDALRAERDALIKEFGQFKNEQREFRSSLYNERAALRADNERLRAAIEKHHWPDLVPGDGPCVVCGLEAIEGYPHPDKPW